MSQAENRENPRLWVRVPVRCESEAVPGYRSLGLTQNVSRGGLLLEVPRVVPQGSMTSLRLLTGEGIAYADAEVIWATQTSPGGMGLKFTRMDEADAHSWKELLVLQAGPTPRSSLRIPIDLEVTCVVNPDTNVQGRLENLSDAGMMVVLPRAIPPQTRVHVSVPEWLILPPVEAEVIWNRAGPERQGALHGLRVLKDDLGKELFLIGTILRIFVG
ncbi:MAG: PilZ domain-containing protein [candidate division NC10 bacterium]